MASFNIPLIFISSFIVALFFCFFANLIVPKYLKKKLFSKEWWYYVFFVTVMFVIVYLFSSLSGGGEKTITAVSEANFKLWESLAIVAGILFVATFYIKEKRIKTILFWLAGLIILLVSLYCFCLLKMWTFQVISGLFFGIFILAYGPTGKLDKIVEKIKERKQENKK